jgi:cell division protein FtsI/penicillin-binding protein 2
MAAGDVLYAPSTRAMILSNTVSGALAGTSLVNGNQRFFVTQGSLRSLSIALARSNVQPGITDTTTLALHNGLTNSLDSATADFIKARSDVDAIEAVVLDARTGGIRALVGRSAAGPSAFLPGFEPSYIGSVVKPIIVTAILSEQPELADFRVQVSRERVTEVRGVPVAAFNAGPAVGEVGVREAMRMSSNKFAAELVFESLARSNGSRLPFDKRGDIPLGLLERTHLALGLLSVFDVQPGGDKSHERDERIWWASAEVPSIIPAMERQPWYWPWASRPSLFETQADSLRGASPTALSRFSYGQGFNEWTLLGGAQAFARVVTARPIVASMLPNGSSFQRFPWATAEWAQEVRAGLRDVVQTGTAHGLESSIQAAFGSRPVDVFGKTGTAHLDDADPFADRNALGLFITPHSATPEVPSCGAAIVLAVDYVGARPAGGERHLEFARSVLAPLLARHWKVAISCANP